MAQLSARRGELLVVRALAFLLLTVALATACSSEEAATKTCAACQHHYTSCSFSSAPESLTFSIEASDDQGCVGKVQGAPMRLNCEPLTLCWDATGQCQSVSFADGVLSLGNLDYCN